MSSNVTAVPEGFTSEQAAATVVGADNAARGLALLDLREGETLVVTGASGALGSAAVQFARHGSLRVIGTASASNAEFLRSIGATPVAYGEGLADRIRAAAPDGVDAALDTAGKGLLPALVEVRGGPERVVTLVDPDADGHGVPFSAGGAHNRNRAFVRDALELIAAGHWVARIGHTLPLAEAAEAHRLVASGHTGGGCATPLKRPITISAPIGA